jgi:hypothetical protein
MRAFAINVRHGLSPTSLRRHTDRHLSRALGKAAEKKRFDIDAEKLTAWVAGLQTKTLILLGKAEEADDLPSAARFIREARASLELLGRVAGTLEPSAAIAIDARRQFAVLSGLSEKDLRALGARRRDRRGSRCRRSCRARERSCPTRIARVKTGRWPGDLESLAAAKG